MPDHFHVLLTPTEGASLEKAMQMIKGGSAHTIKQVLNYASRVWQQGFHDRWIRDAAEYRARVECIRANPIGAKLAEKAHEYLLPSVCGKYRMDANQYDLQDAGTREPV
jgi:REP element-mobilizing transposase RayT